MNSGNKFFIVGGIVSIFGYILILISVYFIILEKDNITKNYVSKKDKFLEVTINSSPTRTKSRNTPKYIDKPKKPPKKILKTPTLNNNDGKRIKKVSKLCADKCPRIDGSCKRVCEKGEYWSKKYCKCRMTKKERLRIKKLKLAEKRKAEKKILKDKKREEDRLKKIKLQKDREKDRKKLEADKLKKQQEKKEQVQKDKKKLQEKKELEEKKQKEKVEQQKKRMEMLYKQMEKDDAQESKNSKSPSKGSASEILDSNKIETGEGLGEEGIEDAFKGGIDEHLQTKFQNETAFIQAGIKASVKLTIYKSGKFKYSISRYTRNSQFDAKVNHFFKSLTRGDFKKFMGDFPEKKNGKFVFNVELSDED